MLETRPVLMAASGNPSVLGPSRRLAVGSLLWVMLAVCVPALHAAGFAPVLTLGLLLLNFVVCMHLLVFRKRIAVFLSIAQVALFSLLNYQVFRVYGPQHYTYDYEPGFFSWVEFTAAHVLRAVDILDILEQYGIDLQNIKHASPLSGAILVLLHFMVDIFLGVYLARTFLQPAIDLVCGKLQQLATWIPGMSRLWGAEAGSHRSRWLWGVRLLVRGLGWFFLLPVIGVWAFWWSWNWADCFLWPLDNLLRVLDFVDAMNTFGWRLDRVQDGFWVETLAVAFRFVVGLFVTFQSDRLLVHLLGHRAPKDVEGFVDDLDDLSAGTRLRAVLALGELGPTADAAVSALIRTLGDQNWPVGEAAARALRHIRPQWEQSREARAAVPDLIKRIEIDDHNVRGQAIWALGQIGPTALAAVPAIVPWLANGPYGIGYTPAGALDRIDLHWATNPGAQAAIPALRKKLEEGDQYQIQPAAWTLAKLGVPTQEIFATLIRKGKARELARVFRELGSPPREAVPVLSLALIDWEPDVVRTAVEALLQLDAAQEGITALLQWLGDEDQTMRSRAAEALGQFGDAARTAVPTLLRMMRGACPYRRDAAAEALRQMGPVAQDAVPALIELLVTGNSDVVWAAGKALKAIDPHWGERPAAQVAMAGWIKRLDEAPQWWWREAAVKALGAMGPAAQPAIPALMRALAADEGRLEQHAALALGEIGPLAHPAVPWLIQHLGTGSHRSKEMVEVLNRIDRDWVNRPEASAAILALVPGLCKDAPWCDQEATADALGQLGPAAAVAVPALIGALSDSSPSMRQAAARALGRIGDVAAEQAVPPLTQMLMSDDRSEAEAAAAEALGLMGPVAAEATAALLVRRLERRCKTVPHPGELDCLGRMGSAAQSAIPTFINWLEDGHSWVRRTAVRALGRIGVATPVVIAVLRVMLTDTDRWVREETAKALGVLGLPAKEAIGDLVKRLADKESVVRIAAVIALGQLIPASLPAVPALLPMLTSAHQDIRGNAVEVLKQIASHCAKDPTGEHAVPTLIAMLTAANWGVRKAAALALGQAGPAARTAGPALCERLDDDDDAVRKAAAWALAQIDPQRAKSAAA